MHIWQLQEAKARLSEVIRDAIKEGPQAISVRGEETAIILSKQAYDELQKPKTSFIDFINSSPLKGVDLNITRDKSLPRDIEL